MKHYLSLSASLLLCTLLIGCSSFFGEEIARLPINQVSTNDSNLIIKEVSLDLKAGEEIAIWSDMDIEYEGNVGFRFKMEILKDGNNFKTLEIDPTKKNITIGEYKSQIMDKTSWSFSGKNGEVQINDSGKYTFKALFIASQNPSLVIKKAEIVLKK